jgi:hypothetical protein
LLEHVEHVISFVAAPYQRVRRILMSVPVRGSARSHFGRILNVGLIAAALTLGVAVSPVSAGSVSIGLHCYSNPELTTVHNYTGHGITVNSVGSTYHPYSFEPFYVYHYLAAGNSITYQTGRAAYRHVLTHDYIYNNNGLDGARVRTTVGTFTKHC